MGKAYVFHARSAARARTMGNFLIEAVRKPPFKRKGEMSIAYQRPEFEGWRVIVDVCGIASPEIDSIHAAIQESEGY